ncbi:MAG TPA: hypothetical protein VEL76_27595 [Gemmataceae bacterium]|nr:hypothetical protein [Gemmataceae bacterium]
MPRRLRPALAALVALTSVGASHRTPNFQVEAPTPEVARQVGAAAERHRKALAVLWLGKEMAPWAETCALQVDITLNGTAGSTTFDFANDRVCVRKIKVRGQLDRVLSSVLPHEIAHTIFAHQVRQPVPRWADEGAAVLAGDLIDHQRFDRQMRRLLQTGQEMSLRRLFACQDFPPYPEQILALYAQGYSVSRFLLEVGDRQTFLGFLARALREGWDNAVRVSYRYQSVDQLEVAWRAWVRKQVPQ